MPRRDSAAGGLPHRPRLGLRLRLCDRLWRPLSTEERHADHPDVVRAAGARSIRIPQRGEIESGRLGEALTPPEDAVRLPSAKARSRSAPDSRVSPETTLTPSTDTTASTSSRSRLRTLTWYSLPGLPTTYALPSCQCTARRLPSVRSYTERSAIAPCAPLPRRRVLRPATNPFAYSCSSLPLRGHHVQSGETKGRVERVKRSRFQPTADGNAEHGNFARVQFAASLVDEE